MDPCPVVVERRSLSFLYDYMRHCAGCQGGQREDPADEDQCGDGDCQEQLSGRTGGVNRGLTM